MGSNPGEGALNVLTGGIAGVVKAAEKGDGKRGILSLLTAGTSEWGTGGGEYGDETVADTIFPKFINDAMLDERTKARADKDAAVEAEKAEIEAEKPKAAPDLTDGLLGEARKAQMLRQKSGAGRGSTFLSGPKTALGG